jgi:hypothetical protein
MTVNGMKLFCVFDDLWDGHCSKEVCLYNEYDNITTGKFRRHADNSTGTQSPEARLLVIVRYSIEA